MQSSIKEIECEKKSNTIHSMLVCNSLATLEGIQRKYDHTKLCDLLFIKIKIFIYLSLSKYRDT